MSSILYVKAYTVVNYDTASSTVLWDIHYATPDYIYGPNAISYSVAQGAQNPSATPYPLFPTPAAAISYYSSAASTTLLADFNAAYGATVWTTTDVETIDSAILTKFNSLATVANTGSYNDLINQPSLAGTRTQSTLSLSLVGTGATGTQIDAAHDALVSLTVSTSATATIAGAATSTVALKICATNNATEGSWTTVQTSETSQSYSLAVALQGVTSGKGCLVSLVPAGWYVKLVNSGSGTHSETFVSGQKVIYS